MVNVKIIDPSRIRWEVPNVLYRGNTQARFEDRIITSFVKGKPIYYGFEVGGNKGKRTYVDTSPSDGLFYASYRIKDIIGGDSILNKYPLIMSIQADKYLDKLRMSDEGEGMFIEGGIDADDINVLFGSECNKLPEKISRYMICEVELHQLDKGNSLIKRYQQKQKNTMSDLELLCFGYTMELAPRQQRQKKIAEAMAYLTRKLEGN